jgi:phosphohistidine phosphatase
MDIYLLRHGIAESHAASDEERDLTAEGREKVRDVAATAHRAGVRPSLVISSPYRRALATARIAVEVLGYRNTITETRVLVPEGDPPAVWDLVRSMRDEPAVLLVGHQPLFGSLGAYLLGAPEMYIDFKKGALMAIEIPAFGFHPRGILKWMLTARLTA